MLSCSGLAVSFLVRTLRRTNRQPWMRPGLPNNCRLWIRDCRSQEADRSEGGTHTSPLALLYQEVLVKPELTDRSVPGDSYDFLLPPIRGAKRKERFLLSQGKSQKHLAVPGDKLSTNQPPVSQWRNRSRESPGLRLPISAQLMTLSRWLTASWSCSASTSGSPNPRVPPPPVPPGAPYGKASFHLAAQGHLFAEALLYEILGKVQAKL